MNQGPPLSPHYSGRRPYPPSPSPLPFGLNYILKAVAGVFDDLFAPRASVRPFLASVSVSNFLQILVYVAT